MTWFYTLCVISIIIVTADMKVAKVTVVLAGIENIRFDILPTPDNVLVISRIFPNFPLIS